MFSARVLALLTALVSFSAIATGQSLQLLETYRGPDPVGCNPPSATTTFLSTDITVNAYLQLNGLSAGDTVNLYWYGPDNNVDTTSTFAVISGGSGCFFTDLNIAQLIAPSGFGSWQVQVVVNRQAVGAPSAFQVNSVVPLQPNLTLATSPNPSLIGQTVTLTATISPASLSGIVTFFDGALEIGAANLMNGSASFTISYLAAGNHALTVFYAGDNVNYNPILSAPVNQLVTPSGSQIIITASGGTPQSTAPGTAFPTPLQVTVTDSFGNPQSGITVTFTAPSSGASAILSSGNAVTNALGVASVTATANFTTGAYAVTATLGALSVSFFLTNGPNTGPIDLALGKTATQSSSFPGSPLPGAAVDGNTDGNFSDGSVTATNLDANAWWQLDLGASASISSIAVWNRTDCCSSRLNDYWVFVSDTPFGPTDTPANLQFRAGTWSSHQTAIPNPSIIIASGAQGRYVRVQLTGANYLSLAEVQVFGTFVSTSGSNLALGRVAAQSSTLPGYAGAGASSAVDGNTDGNFFDGSVTATNLDTNAWWQVDLGSSATIASIVIWNRTDCCSSRLSDYWVFVSNTPFSPTDTPANLQFQAGTFSSHQIATPNPSIIIPAGAQGRYVRVQLSGTNYLSLAEVQVLSQ
jgi:hypothetical protein